MLSDGTNLKGLIDYRGWIQTPNQIKFKNNDQIIIYTASEISEFYVNNDKYISRKVELDITKQNLQNLSGVIVQETIVKKIFLKVLVEGQTNLYTYRDGRKHFFVSKEERTIELIKLRRTSNFSAVSSYNKYIGQLKVLFSDCSKSLQIEKSQFGTRSLIKIVDDYNKCKIGKSDFIMKKSPIQLEFYVIGGYKLSFYEIAKNTNIYSNYIIDSPNKSTVAYGIAFNINLLSHTRKLQLYNELLYQKYNFDASFREQRLEEQYIDNSLKIDLGYAELTNMIRYNFNNRPNLYVNAGITNAFKVLDNSMELVESFFFGTERTRERDPLGGEILTHKLAFSIGAGINLNKISTEIRYSFNSRISDFPVISKAENIVFVLAYKIF